MLSLCYHCLVVISIAIDMVILLIELLQDVCCHLVLCKVRMRVAICILNKTFKFAQIEDKTYWLFN